MSVRSLFVRRYYRGTTLLGCSTLFIAILLQYCTSMAWHGLLSHLRETLPAPGLPRYPVVSLDARSTSPHGTKLDCDSWRAISNVFGLDLHRSTNYPVAHDTDMAFAAV